MITTPVRLLTIPALLAWALVEIVALQRTQWKWRNSDERNSQTKVTELTHSCHTPQILS